MNREKEIRVIRKQIKKFNTTVLVAIVECWEVPKFSGIKNGTVSKRKVRDMCEHEIIVRAKEEMA